MRPWRAKHELVPGGGDAQIGPVPHNTRRELRAPEGVLKQRAGPRALAGRVPVRKVKVSKDDAGIRDCASKVCGKMKASLGRFQGQVVHPGNENQRRPRARGDPLSIQWIPACAGMARFSGGAGSNGGSRAV